MYYIESDIVFQDGWNSVTLNLHTISQIRVDYINNEIEVQIASYTDKDAWYNDKAEKITGFLFAYEVMDFDIDPHLIAWRHLISKEGCIFYKQELKKVYNMNDFYEAIEDNN